jgi:hypothetical protein
VKFDAVKAIHLLKDINCLLFILSTFIYTLGEIRCKGSALSAVEKNDFHEDKPTEGHTILMGLYEITFTHMY